MDWEYFNTDDTIAAVSTPYGTGGIGIIRISGGHAFVVARRLFAGKKPFDEIKSHTINYGKIVNPANGATIDEVLLSKMEKPNTFTREDVVEVNCHGGITVLKSILGLIFKEGVRPAGPGEFTKRAFLNGRIDLSQAEAVIDLINAKTAEGSYAAAAQLEGRLSEDIKGARRKLIELIAHIEVTVDYPEHDTEEITGKYVYEEILKVRSGLSKIAESFDRGRLLREGVNVVIAGKPNVGKSSLLNGLVGASRAIVTDVPGTTRDVIEEYVNIKGLPVKLSDTAGIRKTNDPVESIGVKKAERSLETADLVIVVLDASTGFGAEDADIIRKAEGKRFIYLINKTDLADEKDVSAIEKMLPEGTAIMACLLDGTGIGELEDAIEGIFIGGGIDVNSEVLVTNARHKNLLDKAASSLDDACAAYEARLPLDFVTIDIREAAGHLGSITGESVSEDVVQEIFSRFCVGK